MMALDRNLNGPRSQEIWDWYVDDFGRHLSLNPSLAAARDNLKFLDATPERTRFHRQPKPTHFKGS